MRGRVLVVAGSDSGGGAGLQADLKTISALGGYGATAVTALTAQNTQGVFAVHEVPPDFVRRQMAAVLEDIGADVVKTGMLAHAGIIEVVAEALQSLAGAVPLVVDPVMVAKGGAPLLAGAALDALRTLLLPRAALITPNLPEAEALLGRAIAGRAAMERAAADLLALGCGAVLLKGGHMDGDDLLDVLARPSGLAVFSGRRIATTSTHGTGCTLASAIACGLAQGMDLMAAVERGRVFVRRALQTAPGLGRGHGPLDHLHAIPDYSW